MVVLLATALVKETFQLVVVLMLGAVVAFAVDARVETQPPDPHEGETRRLVVFGDSYISGEGATRYFPNTNEPGAAEECRRAATAYPYLVADWLDYGLDFYACSGAVTDEVAAPNSEIPTQLEKYIADRDDRRRDSDEPIDPPVAVLVSVGGNDAWFGTVGQACLGPGDCDAHRDVLLSNVEHIVDRIEAVYRHVKKVVEDDAGGPVPIVAMPYPLAMKETSCGSSLLFNSEHRFLFEFTNVLNWAVQTAAERAGVNFFSPGIGAFDGHRICDGSSSGDADVPLATDEAVSRLEDAAGENWEDLCGSDFVEGRALNVVDAQAKEGSLSARLRITSWLHGSAHPNEIGHRLTACALGPWLNELSLRAAAEPEDANPPIGDPPVRAPAPPGQTVVSTRLLGIPTEFPLLGVVVLPEDLGRFTIETLPDGPAEIVAHEFGESKRLDAVRSGTFVYSNQPTGQWESHGPVAKDDNTYDVPGWPPELSCGDNATDDFQIIVWQAEDDSPQWRVVALDYCDRPVDESNLKQSELDIADSVPVPDGLFPRSEIPVARQPVKMWEADYEDPTTSDMKIESLVYFAEPDGQWRREVVANENYPVPTWDCEQAPPATQTVVWQDKSGDWSAVNREPCHSIDLGVGGEALPPSVPVVASELGDPYTLTDVKEGSFVYASQPDGGWVTRGPVPPEGIWTIEAWDRETQLDFDATAHAPRQVIVWEEWDVLTGDMGWQVAARHYCELDPECPDSEDEIRAWTASQLGDEIERGTIPVLLLFLGTWSFVILRQAERLSALAAVESARRQPGTP